MAALILTKFVAIDSKILGQVFNSDKITFVKKTCKFNDFQKPNDQDTFGESSLGLTISYHAFCNSLFNFEFLEWTNQVEERNFQEYGSPRTTLSTIYKHKVSPPPRA
ncbi:MAG TPA: hypothetical protein VFM59_00350 [Salinimicrobium sp.]|nr:hypothetical protein [Salinimicrobium sp.]